MIRARLAWLTALLCLCLCSPAFAIVVQSKSTSASSGNGALTLTGAPTPGNLILGCLASGSGDPQSIANTTSWTVVAHGGTGNGGLMMVARYAVGGDTAALPNMTVSSAGFQAEEAIEVSGVSGTIGTDIETTDAKYSQSTATVALGALTTGHANDLVAICAANYDAGGNLSITSGWTAQELNNNFSNYGAWAYWWQGFPLSGSTPSATMTPNTTGHPFGYIAAVLNGVAPIVTTEQTSKVNGYWIFNYGATVGVSASKGNAYFVLQTLTTPKRLNFHTFP